MKKNGVKRFFGAIGNEFADLGKSFVYGDWKTKLSFVLFGAGNLLRGQIVKGGIYLLFEAVFIYYMITRGSYWLSMLPSLGLEGPTEVYDEFYDTYLKTYNDNSFQILLYGIMTLFFILAMVITWRMNIKSAYATQQRLEQGKKIPHFIDDLKSLIDEKFYKTLLALPLTGIIMFTLLPIVFMILIAFTNYDGAHDGYVTNLFTWVGFENFKTMFSSSGANSNASVFGGVLGWTLVWAFFATFSNYILGILVAMMINRKGIRFKKLWRTILVMTIAIPQFISLMYVSKMFSLSGLVNGTLVKWGWITNPIKFWDDPTLARIMVVLINIWIGIPYQMLIATGILMNIPEDLYEASKIDGASPFQQFRHITMPYMLFVTAPYLLTSFTGNMNNFNVIYLLNGGGPINGSASTMAGNVGYTDLLVTWLFKITTGAEAQYYAASVIGIIVFVVVAVITLGVYGILPSVKNEEDMQ